MVVPEGVSRLVHDIYARGARPPIDELIAAFAAVQEGVVGRRQLLAAGLGRGAIDHRVARKRLHPIFPGVYAVGHKNVSRRGWMFAAQLYADEESCFSHATAGELRRVIKPRTGEKFHITAPTRREHPWIAFHQSTALTAADIETIDGLRVTSLERTFLDLAATESQRTVELAINEAIIRRHFDPQALHAAVERFKGHPGLKTLKVAMKDVDAGLTPTDGEASEELHKLLRRTNFQPRPLYQKRLLTYRPDFLWPEHKLVVEADGDRFHQTPFRRREDRTRNHHLRAHGYEVLRFTYHQIIYQPDYVIATIRAALESRAPTPR